jgi:NADH-quinone oxidoreductase subunit L
VTHLAWLLPALPALAAFIGVVTDRLMPGGPVVAAVAGSAGSLVVACAVFADQLRSPATMHVDQTDWSPFGSTTLHVGTAIDGLSATVALMVAVVALLVQIYSSAYMAGDARYASYAAEVSLFTSAMLLTVVSSNLLELLVGWEVMGLCSYLLVGHYWQTEGSRAAAVKALVTTRIGDAGFVVGIVVLGVSSHSFDIAAVNSSAGSLSHTAVVAGALLLLAGVAGKSAQFPLHVWLPDAMAGPTPISALIHAATMVAAGVFLVARLYPVFLAAPVALTVLGIMACISMLGAALAALAQDDIKRVLAWSTVSQLGYMLAGLAVRGWTAGILHLLGHAAFKALLFLAAGSVLRAVGTNLMSEMGGLWRRMPITFGVTLVGGASLAGIPPFAGVFGKDAVIDAARAHGGALGITVAVVGLVTELVTAAYVTRLVCRTFLGQPRTEATVHESPTVMTIPLVVLAVATVGLGLPALSSSYGVRRWLDAPAGTLPLHVTAASVLLSTGLALLGAAAVAVVWLRSPAADPIRVLGRWARPLRQAFWVDDLYGAVVVRPVVATARAVLSVDTHGIDATAVGAGRLAALAGGGVRRLQTGNVQLYATGLIGGVLAIVLGVALAVSR